MDGIPSKKNFRKKIWCFYPISDATLLIMLPQENGKIEFKTIIKPIFVCQPASQTTVTKLEAKKVAHGMCAQ